MSRSASNSKFNAGLGMKSNGGGVPLNAGPKPSSAQLQTNQQVNPMRTIHPTSSYAPSYLIDLIPELGSYQQLLEAEKKLDVYLARKKVDLYQSISQWNNNSKQPQSSFSHYDKDQVRYLRIFVSNIAENQPWQQQQSKESTKEDATEKPEEKSTEPSWTLRIEGRLIDDTSGESPERAKFSSFIQDIAVDFKKIEVKQDEEREEEVTGASNSITTQNTQPDVSESFLNDGTTNNMQTQPDERQQPAEPKVPLAQPQEDTTQIIDAVEWHFDPKNPVEFDGLDVKRPGTENVDCTVTIQPKGVTGHQLEYSKELSSIIGKSRGSLHDAVYSLYKYILINNLLSSNGVLPTGGHLLDDESENKNGERTIVQLDDFLATLLPQDLQGADRDGDVNMTGDETAEPLQDSKKTMKLTEFLPLVNSHIHPISPIRLDYKVRVDKSSTYGEVVFDIEVPDIAGLQGNASGSANLPADGLQLLNALDDRNADLKPRFAEMDKQITTLQLQLNDTANKYQFFNKLAQNPVPFLQEYIESSANALKVLSGDEGFNEDTVRRSQFYKDNEAILFENLGTLLANGRI
ncbi:Rsc6p KNAG_0I02570 [Huiozyma naganishii CBS 8797]|uniref:DM2 domain-containing protein n=1 Tax=Huiozyma naganishii (strain ATCC MYA-139 / BCRC 22969 / CBS 8797 / KCTC 17520 / NBRC 10181 / NCYC 3082 / Yp74L-3) TaxID=1071383 RepID=J7S2I6_HUIN7|nr:hypothetical protein KNAG_0I02570 [Kazachstania naganishii CBS 8797]CCK72042.1 hypothetical protein KNAG_0I02570 [Kazachstania naganishii CBS 8797]